VFDLLLCKAFVAMKQLDETWALSVLRVGTHDPVTQVEDGLIECIVSTAAPIAARLTAASVAVSLAQETTMHRVAIMGTASEEEKEEDLTTDEAHDANAFELLMGNELANVLRVAFTSAPHDRQHDAIGELLCWALCMAKVDVLAGKRASSHPAIVVLTWIACSPQRISASSRRHPSAEVWRVRQCNGLVLATAPRRAEDLSRPVVDARANHRPGGWRPSGL
jgi:hypothetical protein